jgi:endonuclease G
MLTMINTDPTTWRAARRALEKAIALHLDDPNVSLVDLGFRLRSSEGHRLEPELAVRVHVRQKLYGEAFRKFAARHPHRVIDAERLGFAVDVPQAGYHLHEWQGYARKETSLEHNRHARFYPVLRGSKALSGGVSISNVLRRGFGTLGGKVRDRHNGEEMILSTWQVLDGARSKKPGTLIYPTEQAEDASETEVIAEFTRDAMHAHLDAAVARLNGKRPLLNEQLGIGAVTGTVMPQLGMRVIKSGGRTGVTAGVITGVLGYAVHCYHGANRITGQIVHITPEAPDQIISAPGDSGSWWLERSTLRAAALHFAGSNDPNFALALSMPQVLSALEVDIVTDRTPVSSLALILNSTVGEKSLQKKVYSGMTWGLSDEYEIIDTVEVEILDEEELLPVQKRIVGGNGVLSKITAIPPGGAARTSNPVRQLVVSHKIARACLLAALCAAMTGFGLYLLKIHRQQTQQIGRLQRHLLQLQATAQIDSARRDQIRKVTAIIDRHNPGMKADLKFRIAGEIYEMSRKYKNLEVELICATITHETGRTWNPHVVSPAGAMGLMQILPTTGVRLAAAEGIAWSSAEKVLFDPIFNLRLGCRYLSALVEAYSLDAGLAAYNGGEKRAERWVRSRRAHGILHEETAAYVPSVLRIYEEYRRVIN